MPDSRFAHQDARLKEAYSKLKTIRTRTDLSLKPTPLLKKTFTGFDGEEHELKIRYYQVQGILHLVAMNRFLLGDDTGTGKCQPYNSLVLTEEGLVPIGEIADWSEMEPDTFRPMHRRLHVLVGGERLPIKNFYYGGIKPTVVVTTEHGFKNTGSEVHPMLVFRDGQHQWVQARDLVQGDLMCIEICENPFPDMDPFLKGSGPFKTLTPDLARFFGHCIGKGLLSAKEQGLYLRQLVSLLFGGPEIQISPPLGDRQLRRWLHLNGLRQATSTNHEVPDCILRASKESNQEFLRAVFEGRGEVGKDSIELTTTSKRLAEQLQIMLLRFGVVSQRPSESEARLVDRKGWKFWSLVIRGFYVMRFRDQIGFISAQKKEALNRVLDEVQTLSEGRGGTPTTPYFYDPIVSLKKRKEEVFDIEVEDPRHHFVSNGFLNHNTLMSISACCYVWAKEPNTKVVILTNKSVVGQWALEFEKFCDTDKIQVMMCAGTPAKRQKVYQQFLDALGPTVLIMGYATARRDIKHLQDLKDFVLVTDEAATFKNPSTQVYQVVRHLSNNASRFWALTATLIKNNLVEGYGIFSLVVPGLFPSTKNKFMGEYCITRLQSIPGSRRQVPVIVGYRKEQISKFRDKIDPYFLARAKQDVASELPVLTIREHSVGLTHEQESKYQEALTGLLEIDTTGEEKETTKLTQLIYCQQIVDHPELIECEGGSEKMEELFEMLTTGELAEEKIIVFSRFRKMIDLLETQSKKHKIKSVRITGAEDEEERKEAMKEFQNPKADSRVCWITTAAAEGINLQAAKALIFYDTPWSAGDYLQILGRMIRIGSTHDRCYAIHLVAKDTIDSRVMGVLKKKMKLVEQVMGKRIKGESMVEVEVSTENDISDIFSALQADARTRRR
jgi:hypothetical protein